MKIAQVVSYYPPHLGGMENVAREISERLAIKGNQVEVFTSDIGCNKGKLRSTKNLKIHYLKSWEFAHTAIMPSLFFKLLKISKDSIIHVHIAQPLVPEVVYLVSKIKKIPYIAHVHGEPRPSGKFGFLFPLYKKLFKEKILLKAEKVICLSEDYKQFINKKYGINESKIIVIPNGVSERFFVNKENVSSKHTNLLFVGRLDFQKNLPKLINVVSLIKSKVVLHIIGDGEKKKEIEKLIYDKKLKNVILYGKKTGKDIVNFYKNADIFILTSVHEGLPLVLLEAMASCTPIVAPDIIGIRGFVKKAGILVNPPTPENFARVIDDLIEDKKLINILAQRGRKKANNYDWNKIVKKFEDVYENVKEAKLK